jgi:hypothetical protein
MVPSFFSRCTSFLNDCFSRSRASRVPSRTPTGCPPEQAAFAPLRGARHIETPPFPLGCDAVYVRGQEGSLLLEVTPAGEFDRIAEYESGAWFEGIARCGRTLAFPSADRRAVRLVEAVRSAKSEPDKG